MRPMINPLHGALLRAIRKVAGQTPIIESLSGRTWASATFAGEKLRLAIRLEGDDPVTAADRLVLLLGEAELPMPGHIVADLALAAREDKPHEVRLMFDVLTVES